LIFCLRFGWLFLPLTLKTWWSGPIATRFCPTLSQLIEVNYRHLAVSSRFRCFTCFVKIGKGLLMVSYEEVGLSLKNAGLILLLVLVSALSMLA
jgi:hypothetical protein